MAMPYQLSIFRGSVPPFGFGFIGEPHQYGARIWPFPFEYLRGFVHRDDNTLMLRKYFIEAV